ncbi:MAG: peptidoglycan bridge formation glycyltransferase FemA/FemB family protein, partial [Ktedonobacteraceae bacterium]|nr:peptidoglycan bridge formation glycyltransferase FemA/FemB family protein [Ktedonobacteraceae bacterium]
MSAQNQRYILRAVAEEQRTLWDEWMNAQPGGHLLQSWTWGELKSESGWHPLRLALWDDERTEIVAAAQVLRRSAPRMPLRLGHLAYIPKGPVIDWSRADLCTTFFSQFDQCLRRQGALALRMELNFETGTQAGELVMKRMQELSTRPERTIQPLRTIIVDLEPDEDAILARMKEKWRYNIGLARRRGVTVRVAETEQDVRSWYALLQVTSERETFG